MNTVPNIEVILSLTPEEYHAAISTPFQQLLDLVNIHFICIICPAMKKKITLCLNMWLNDSWPKQLHSILIVSCKAQFEFTTTITKELRASESKSQ
jgi:hypothetical protein